MEKWVAANRADLKPQITLLPTGTGQPKKIDVAGLEAVGRACFFPDGKRLLVNGAEHGQAWRTYAVDTATGKPIPITPEGVVSHPALSHDGTEVAAQDLSGNIAIYSVGGKSVRTVPGTDGLQPLQWSVDGHWIYATVPDEMPGRLLRVDVISGRQQLVRRLLPGESGGVYSVWSPQVAPDGNVYAYSYRQTLSTLYVAEGLQ